MDLCLNSTEIPKDIKQKVQNIGHAIQLIIEEEDTDEIVSTLNAVTPEKMAEKLQKRSNS